MPSVVDPSSSQNPVTVGGAGAVSADPAQIVRDQSIQLIKALVDEMSFESEFHVRLAILRQQHAFVREAVNGFTMTIPFFSKGQNSLIK